MTKVKVNAGACGFETRIVAEKQDKRSVILKIDSGCKAVTALAARLEALGPIGLKDILSKGIEGNRIFQSGAETLSHASCPALSAVIKCAEVELGLNIPAKTVIEFEIDE